MSLLRLVRSIAQAATLDVRGVAVAAAMKTNIRGRAVSNWLSTTDSVADAKFHGPPCDPHTSRQGQRLTSASNTCATMAPSQVTEPRRGKGKRNSAPRRSDTSAELRVGTSRTRGRQPATAKGFQSASGAKRRQRRPPSEEMDGLRRGSPQLPPKPSMSDAANKLRDPLEPQPTLMNPFMYRPHSLGRNSMAWLLAAGLRPNAANPLRFEVGEVSHASLKSTEKWFLNGNAPKWRMEAWKLLELATKNPDAARAALAKRYEDLTLAYTPPRLDATLDTSVASMAMTPDQQNVLSIALKGVNVFIGGTAGTGKTVLLKVLYRQLLQLGLRVAVTATTGVAAVQLGGCTFHKAFDVPWKTKRSWDVSALRSVDVVIIDEVSLLSAEVLELFDSEARRARVDSRPFGGLQVVASGDFLQLSVSGEGAVSQCFEAPAFNNFLKLQLVTPMRHQRDGSLFKMLSELRKGQFDSAVFQQLDRPIPAGASNITYVFPMRSDAVRVNDAKLAELESEEQIFVPQRGPLELFGRFTPSVCVEVNPSVHSDQIQESVHAAIADAGLPSAGRVSVVVMPSNQRKHTYLIRCLTSKDNELPTPASASSRAWGSVDAARSPDDQWVRVVCAAMGSLGGKVQQTHATEPVEMVPLSVSLSLAACAMDPSSDVLSPMRLKVGCQVMVNRNLSRLVSNGSVGVVEGFAKPNAALFPRTASPWVITQLLRKYPFPTLPIVRLRSGDTIQVPPVVSVAGGAPQTYFYGHEIARLPLQLGYAFTVHKVQGLTLDGTVVLDCKNFFRCPHLIYVACSRVKSIDQLVVHNTTPDMVIVDREALKFSMSLLDASAIHVPAAVEGLLLAAWTEASAPTSGRVPLAPPAEAGTLVTDTDVYAEERSPLYDDGALE